MGQAAAGILQIGDEDGKKAGLLFSPMGIAGIFACLCVLTNGKLTKAQCTKLASIAHDEYARAIRPAHTTAGRTSLWSEGCVGFSIVVNFVNLSYTILDRHF